MRELMWMAGKAFFIALVLTPIIRDISRSFHVVDRPGNRKIHAHPVPRVGGIAIAIAYGLSLIAISGVDRPAPSGGVDPWTIIPGAAIVFLVGLLDDFFSLKPLWKLAGLVLAASVAFLSGMHMGDVALHPLPPWLDYALTVFWLVLATNALNLIDGLDGLCGGMGLLSALTLFTAAMLRHNLPLAYATLPLAGALAGFLCYNFNPATVFIGDSGALLVGFLLGGFGLVWTQKASTLLSMIVPLLALSIPLLDVSLSVLRRALRGQPIFRGDRGHIHHRLLDSGLTPWKAVWVLYLVGALAAAFALLGTTKLGGRFQGLVIAAFCVLAWFGVKKLRYAEFDMVGRLLFDARRPASPGHLEAIASALESADGIEAWWDALAREGKTLGFTALRWSGGRVVRERSLAPGSPGGWSLRVPLPGAGEIHVEGVFGNAMTSRDLGAVMDIIERTCPEGSRALHPAAGAPAGGA